MRAHRQRAGRRIDGRRGVVERAAMRIAGLGLQADLDRNLLRSSRVNAALRHVGAHAQHVLLADVEVHVDRIELHDGGEHGRRRRAADILADRDLARRDDAVERRRDLGVVEVELGQLRVDLRLVRVACGVARGQRLVVVGLGRGLPRHQLGLPLEVACVCFRSPPRRLRRPSPVRASPGRARARW